ncbi:MAG TPA: glycosyltransferase family 4 protein [Conexibacter sp.]|nr:glycosyltransferase family 4 protein [Conexibacter sp.]
MDAAAYHHLPTGGALRVLAEWTRHTAAERVTVYTPDPSVHAFADFPERVRVMQVDVPGPFEGLPAAIGLLRSGPAGRRVARRIDGAGHDVVFVLPSRLTQSPAVLHHLHTPTVYYAPEAMRSAYEDQRLVFAGDDWKVRLTRAGLNPIERLRRVLDRRAARAAEHVVTHSQFTRGDLRRNYGVESEVLLLGVDVDAFRPAEAEAGASDAQPYVLSVGALHPLKGHELVVDAVGRLPDDQRPRLVIVGDRGHEGPALEARATRAGVELDLRSGVPFAQVVELMQGATLVACAQIREPFGLVPLEAMACARPVVAVRDGGLVESVQDERTGLLVPRDAQAMADAIRRLLGDPGLRTRLGQAGRATVEAEWRWDRYARDVDRVLAERSAAHRTR